MAAITICSDFGVQVGWTEIPNFVPTDGQQWKSLLGSSIVQLQFCFLCQTLGYV